ncbi:hypothetical protein H5410_043614 [Solanum commersonii]|uniref:Uncharacterized protein n=1 Tax=Solanum commersonii TaxID=4109 RepID=A0A9J5Y196_SOLCO|nr:hypothetical protein H5410_043614 [Solanum commersonii]
MNEGLEYLRPLFSRLWRLLINHKLTLILDRKEKRKPSLQACKRFNIILPTEVSSTLDCLDSSLWVEDDNPGSLKFLDKGNFKSRHKP